MLPVAVAIVYMGLVARRQFLSGDPAYYLGLARSLAIGDGYVFMGQVHTMYPPGLPVLLAPFVRLFGGDALVSQIVVAAFLPLAVLLVMALARARQDSLAVPIAILTVLSVGIFDHGTRGVRTELPFLAASVAALLVQMGGLKGWSAGARGMGAAVLVGVAVAFRTVGIALAIAGLVSWIHRRLAGRRYEPAVDVPLLAGGLAGITVFAAWSWWGMSHVAAGYAEYLMMADPHQADLGGTGMAGILARIPLNLLSRLTSLGEMLTNLEWLAPMWTSPVIVLPALAVGLGLAAELRGPVPVLGWYLLGYGAILLVWPFKEGVRFLVPVFPLALLVGWRGAGLLVGAGRRLGRRRSGGLVLALLAAAVIEVVVTEHPSRQMVAMAFVWAAIAGVLLAPAPSRPWLSALESRPRALGFAWVAAFSVVGLARIGPIARGNLAGVIRSPNRGMAPGVDWLSRNVGRDQVVMAEFPSAVHLYTGLPAVQFPKTGVPDSLLARVVGSGARYLMIGDPPRYPYYRPTEVERLAVLVPALGDRLRRVYRYPEGTIYRID